LARPRVPRSGHSVVASHTPRAAAKSPKRAPDPMTRMTRQSTTREPSRLSPYPLPGGLNVTNT